MRYGREALQEIKPVRFIALSDRCFVEEARGYVQAGGTGEGQEDGQVTLRELPVHVESRSNRVQ